MFRRKPKLRWEWRVHFIAGEYCTYGPMRMTHQWRWMNHRHHYETFIGTGDSPRAAVKDWLRQANRERHFPRVRTEMYTFLGD